MVSGVSKKWHECDRERGSGLGYYADVFHHLILPSISLGTVTLTMITRLTRSRMLEVLQEDYVTTARAKGLSERTVISNMH